jgi:hypothetical protein
MAWHTWKGLLAVGLVLAGVPACAAGGEALPGSEGAGVGGGGGGGGGPGACVPGAQVACACPDGESGAQVCLEDGTGYGVCGPCGGEVGCGDGVCGLDEDCHSCDADCMCAPCNEAPSCVNAQIPPATGPHVAELDVTMVEMSRAALLERLQHRIADGGPGARVVAAALSPALKGESALVTKLRGIFAARPAATIALRRQLAVAGMPDTALYRDSMAGGVPVQTPLGGEFPPGGSESCGAPLLRIRAQKITVHEEDDDFANDIVYCAISAEAAAAAEIRVTPQTPNLDEGDSIEFSIASGIVWGQLEPKSPAGNLLLTYDCFEADTDTGYADLIDAIGQAATEVGGAIGGEYGWVFDVIGAVAGVVSDAVALDGDDHLFNATQIIPLDMQLELTNGGSWSVRRSGTHLNSDWDWELFMQVWGCAEYGSL